MNVYFISGLGADRSVFKYLSLPEGHRMKHLDWIKPCKAETLASYAMRMAEQIDTSRPFALAGLSFGGMLAAEIARHYPTVHTFLISSIPHGSHLPDYYRLAQRSRLPQVFPWALIKHVAIIKHLFSGKTPEDRKMIAAMIQRTEPAFIKWAIQAILEWQPAKADFPITHIHGSKDVILPLRYTRPSHVIEGGDHVLVLNHAMAVNEIFREVLNSTMKQESGS